MSKAEIPVKTVVHTKTYRCRLFPNQYEEQWIKQNIGNRRFLMNELVKLTMDDPLAKYTYAGEEKIERKKQKVFKQSPICSKGSLQDIVKKLSERHEFLKLSHSQSRQEAAHRVAQAWSEYFSPKPELKDRGKPAVKKRKEGNGNFFLPIQNGNVSLCLKTKKLHIKPLQTYLKKRISPYNPNQSGISFRPNGMKLPENAVLKTMRIKKEKSGTYWVSLSYQWEEKRAVCKPLGLEMLKAAGFDLGVISQVIDSEGNTERSHRSFRGAQKKLAALQRSLRNKTEDKKLEIVSKREKPTIPQSQWNKINKRRKADKYPTKKVDRLLWKPVRKDNHFSKEEWMSIYRSSNTKRIQKKITLTHQKIANKRFDHNHCLSKKISSEFDLLFFESLNIKSLSKNRKLSKHILDQGWGQLLSMVKYKAENQGKVFAKIGPFHPSSKTCCRCGHYYKSLSLENRIFECPGCKAKIDRDINAAINILRQGLIDYGFSQQEVEKYITGKDLYAGAERKIVA